jgi:Mn-dependent DtxR family transcriptional regulator
MSIDRLQSEKMSVTQEQISHLLGVRRESVTVTAGTLQKDGMISCARGSITVVDRLQLEERVCECYVAVKQECERLLPRQQPPKSAA